MTSSDAFVLLISPLVGSFLGVVIDRLPEGRPVLWGRSTCDHCGRVLKPWSMIPLVSYLLQRGRCRDCGEAIGRFYPLVEIFAFAVALSAVLLVSGWPLWASLYLGWSLLALAWIDARHRILPDPLNLPLIPSGLLVALLLSPALLPDHLIGAITGFLSLAAVAWIYRRLRGRDGLGLGDAKLFSAAGAWLGWQALPGVLLLAALAALTVALARSAFGDRLGPADAIAFGPYLALALWLGWLLGPLTLW